MNAEFLQSLLCTSLCGNVVVDEKGPDLWRVNTPFMFPDGDGYRLYLRQAASGGWRITDMGATLMHLSYENDIDKFREGTRGRLFGQILTDTELREDEGEFFMEVAGQDLAGGVFRFGQALTRLHDLTFLNRLRVESTFYEDLRELLLAHVDASRLHENFVVPDVPRATDYPVDYFISGGQQPFYLFGVPNRDKARLATIVLQHLTGAGHEFDSMIVFRNMAEIPARDLSRLTNAANDMIDSLDAQPDFQRKIRRRVG